MLKNQAGQILILTLMVTGVSALSTGAMLAVVNVASRSSGDFRTNTEAYYSAAAGIEAVIADLLNGVDALPSTGDPYTPPSIGLNEQPAVMGIDPPGAGNARPKSTYRYIDPGAEAGLAALAPDATWSLEVNGVEPFSTLLMNWAVTTTGNDRPDVKMRVLNAAGKEIARSAGTRVIGFPLTIATRVGSGDRYTLEFENQDSVTVGSQSFSADGGQESTWIFMRSVGKEYLITGAAETEPGRGIAIIAYVRQIPGPGPSSPPLKQTVIVESWQEVSFVGIPATLTPTPPP